MPKSIAKTQNNIKRNGEAEKAIFAGGCFWGMQYHFEKVPGVIKTTVGYIGGTKENPTYDEVCEGFTGHTEAIEIEYDPKAVSFRDLAKLFFEIHDPTELNRQGPDLGFQYRSVVFFLNEEQKKISEELIELLKENGFFPVTALEKASKFWPAEGYHQYYYNRTGEKPYCHVYRKRF